MPDGAEQTICCMPEGSEQIDCQNGKYTFTLTDFKELVISAQHGNSQAIDVLCTSFKPLIYKEAYRYEIREALGEDSVNTAWLIFLELIKSYKDRDFGHLPGLLQYHVHFGLLHKATRGKSVNDCYYLDAEEDGEEMQIADKKVERFLYYGAAKKKVLSRKWGLLLFFLSRIRDLACYFCLELRVFKLLSLKSGVSPRLYYYRTLGLSFR